MNFEYERIILVLCFFCLQCFPIQSQNCFINKFFFFLQIYLFILKWLCDLYKAKNLKYCLSMMYNRVDFFQKKTKHSMFNVTAFFTNKTNFLIDNGHISILMLSVEAKNLFIFSISFIVYRMMNSSVWLRILQIRFRIRSRRLRIVLAESKMLTSFLVFFRVPAKNWNRLLNIVKIEGNSKKAQKCKLTCLQVTSCIEYSLKHTKFKFKKKNA